MSEHTPTPWTIQHHAGAWQGQAKFEIWGPPGHQPRMLAIIPDETKYEKPDDANAEYIIRAVNSHADLLAALRPFVALWRAQLVAGLDSAPEDLVVHEVAGGPGIGTKLTVGDIRRAEAAIEKAKE